MAAGARSPHNPYLCHFELGYLLLLCVVVTVPANADAVHAVVVATGDLCQVAIATSTLLTLVLLLFLQMLIKLLMLLLFNTLPAHVNCLHC